MMTGVNGMTSQMTYLIIVQDSKVTATCFSDHKCWLHDGAVSVGWINSQGRMQEIHHGELVNGHFDPEDSGE